MVETAPHQNAVHDFAERVARSYRVCDSTACRCGLSNICWTQEGHGFRMDETDDFAC